MLWKVVPTAHDLAEWGSRTARERSGRQAMCERVRGEWKLGRGTWGSGRQVLAAVKHSARSSWTAAAAAAVGGGGAVQAEKSQATGTLWKIVALRLIDSSRRRQQEEIAAGAGRGSRLEQQA